jgi:hypothetical protein
MKISLLQEGETGEQSNAQVGTFTAGRTGTPPAPRATEVASKGLRPPSPPTWTPLPIGEMLALVVNAGMPGLGEPAQAGLVAAGP